jgi:hypothetical protein
LTRTSHFTRRAFIEAAGDLEGIRDLVLQAHAEHEENATVTQ